MFTGCDHTGVSLNRRQLRTLRGIERCLAASDPGLSGFFLSFAERAGERGRPRVERVSPWPLRMLAGLRRGPGRRASAPVTGGCAENRNDP